MPSRKIRAALESIACAAAVATGFSCGCGSDTRAGGPAAPQSAQRGDPAAGGVSCPGGSCDVTQGQKCCLWIEGNPIVEKGTCFDDCSRATPSPGTNVEEVTCDGPEDCSGSACCDGKCTTAAQCIPGPQQYCHLSKECAARGGCCTPLFNGSARYGACAATPSGCDYP